MVGSRWLIASMILCTILPLNLVKCRSDKYSRLNGSLQSARINSFLISKAWSYPISNFILVPDKNRQATDIPVAERLFDIKKAPHHKKTNGNHCYQGPQDPGPVSFPYTGPDG